MELRLKHKTDGIVFIILSSAIWNVDMDFVVYGHAEKVNQFGETST
jgi:hypothetical protein